jgi:hypothetical protein
VALRCWGAWWIVLDGFGLTRSGLVAGENLTAQSRVQLGQRLEAQRHTESGSVLNEVSRWARAPRLATEHAVHRATAALHARGGE